jgi:hypothetical protein
MWYPLMPDAEDVAAALKDADVLLSKDSVEFFLRLCGGHRGIFMPAMAWVQDRQDRRVQNRADKCVWDITTTVMEVRSSLSQSNKKRRGGWDVGFRAAIAKSRAVHVNGMYSNLEDVPKINCQDPCGWC